MIVVVAYNIEWLFKENLFDQLPKTINLFVRVDAFLCPSRLPS